MTYEKELKKKKAPKVKNKYYEGNNYFLIILMGFTSCILKVKKDNKIRTLLKCLDIVKILTYLMFSIFLSN